MIQLAYKCISAHGEASRSSKLMQLLKLVAHFCACLCHTDISNTAVGHDLDSVSSTSHICNLLP